MMVILASTAIADIECTCCWCFCVYRPFCLNFFVQVFTHETFRWYLLESRNRVDSVYAGYWMGCLMNLHIVILILLMTLFIATGCLFVEFMLISDSLSSSVSRYLSTNYLCFK